MNQTNWVAIIGAIFAGIVSMVQIFHGSAISTLEDGTMHKDTIQAHVDSLDTWQEEQDRRLDNLELEHTIHNQQSEEVK